MHPFQQAAQFGLTAAIVTVVAACSGGDAHEHGEEGHSHAHSAKFGGTLVELGDHFANVELTHDAETGEVALYTYDAHAEGSKRSSTEAPMLSITPHADGVEPFTMTLEPRVSKTSGETVGDSSKFTGQHDSIKGLDHFEVSIAEIALMGQTFKDVEFLHPADAHDHDGDDHDHDHDGDGDHGEGDGDEGHGDEKNGSDG